MLFFWGVKVVKFLGCKGVQLKNPLRVVLDNHDASMVNKQVTLGAWLAIVAIVPSTT